MRCMERSNRHHGGGRRGRDHAAGAARRRSRDRSGGSKACRPDQRPARYQARNPAAAPGPSTPRRSLHFPSMSAPHDASVSWLGSCPQTFRGTSVSVTCDSGSKRKPFAFTASCSEYVSRRRNQRRAQKSRSHRAAPRAKQNRMCLMMNGSMRNHCCSSCCARTIRRWSRRGRCWMMNCAAGIRPY